ncbi:MAG: HU family DNA-binding protein [Candidatus Gracilibacteria bacterium]|nr:HU family DNA-binding protein [Candidatus Gracilibacteria bacterium]
MAYSKGDLVAAMAAGAGVTKKAAADALDAMITSVTKELKKGGSVTLTGFGTFKVSARAARTGVNPQTGAKIKIPARKVPTFKAGKGLKDAVK